MMQRKNFSSGTYWESIIGYSRGATSLHAAVANPNSAQNTPLHPAETPPANSTIRDFGCYLLS